MPAMLDKKHFQHNSSQAMLKNPTGCVKNSSLERHWLLY
jgi:hypothetical protein